MSWNGLFTVLGSGTSYGVPMIDCHCPVCTSSDPRDRRTRSAGWLHGADGVSIIFDVGPDLRMQAIREDICRLDAVFITHNHADHINGIDDLRGFTKKNRGVVSVYAQQSCVDYIRRSFPYMFREDIRTARGWDVPHLELTALDLEPVVIRDIPVQPIPLIHGTAEIRGYRFGDFAYLTDCSAIPAASYDLLHGVKNVVIDGLRREKHPTHFDFDGAIAAARPIRAEHVYLTHISHEIMHSVEENKLPEGFGIAYDGLTLPVSVAGREP